MTTWAIPVCVAALGLGCDAPGGGRGGAGSDTRADDDAARADVASDVATEPVSYVASQGAGGERCGSDGQDWVECRPRDACRDVDANLCTVVTGDYRAWLDGGGQRCGLNDLGTMHTYCVPRDMCVDPDVPVGICQRQSGSSYPAYKKADGAECGEDGWFFVYCEPNDVCVSVEQNLCE